MWALVQPLSLGICVPATGTVISYDLRLIDLAQMPFLRDFVHLLIFFLAVLVFELKAFTLSHSTGPF
jgi:hypothetical protein